ncbi:MAG: glycosyltransferase, partial [Coriobacteriales bacterium]|nr:glycosyltransferase [Coriobacteriales bacterium]
MNKLAIVIVTYKRQELLTKLLTSISNLNKKPWKIFIVDNEDSKQTQKIVQSFNKNCKANYIYLPQKENSGGAGGFNIGTKAAYDAGAQWFWLMDDDVSLLPDAIEKLEKWTKDYDVVQGSKYNFDGKRFYWQYKFWTKLAIANPFASKDFNEQGYKVTNSACFEGGLFSRKIVETIGLPDARYFIYSDDITYGYLASKYTTPITVEDIVMKRERELKNLKVSGAKRLNSQSDMTRYYIMRNRAHFANYSKEFGDYNPVIYGIGTAMAFARESIRIFAIDRNNIKTSFLRLAKGWKDSHKILNDF